MTCDNCLFHPVQGGTCRGLIKNPGDKVPFYVCPHAEDIDIIDNYLRGSATKRAMPLVPSVSFDQCIISARVSGSFQ
jgi:hypothetical protein